MITWLILVLVVAAFVAGSVTRRHDPPRPCPLCAARAADAREIAELTDLYNQPAYGDD